MNLILETLNMNMQLMQRVVGDLPERISECKSYQSYFCCAGEDKIEKLAKSFESLSGRAIDTLNHDDSTTIREVEEIKKQIEMLKKG